jgi:hypothetical protein
MYDAVEPTAEDFFASATGVCVYENVRGHARWLRRGRTGK